MNTPFATRSGWHKPGPAAATGAVKDVRPCVAQTVIDTPLGSLLAVATARGLAGLWFEGQAHHPGQFELPHDELQPHLKAARAALAAYWHDPRTPRALDLVLDPQGTPFQQQVWTALRSIPPGKTSSYGRIATALGLPQAVRAVGAAVGRNPISVLVPCHRVIGADGDLTGYAGGLERKRALLRHEGFLRH